MGKKSIAEKMKEAKKIIENNLKKNTSIWVNEIDNLEK